MEFAIDGLVVLLFIVIALWYTAWQRSRNEARATAQEQARLDAERQAREVLDARLRQVNASLTCLGCGLTFTGPLTDAGCPGCHLASLVVPAEQERQISHG